MDPIIKMCKILVWRRDEKKDPEMVGKTDADIVDMAWGLYRKYHGKEQNGRTSPTNNRHPLKSSL